MQECYDFGTMNTTMRLIGSLGALLLIGAGCASGSAPRQTATATRPQNVAPVPEVRRTSPADIPIQPKSLAPSIVMTSSDPLMYCDGVKMDSEGYRKTLTVERMIAPFAATSTVADRAKTSAVAATKGMCQTVISQLEITEKDGVVAIPPIDGWAGVSIVMCSCKPEVEVNMLRVPGVKQVVWR